jgi:hypothetical protein
VHAAGQARAKLPSLSRPVPFQIVRKSLLQDLPMFRFRGTAVSSGSTFQPLHKFVFNIPDEQTKGHDPSSA